MVSDQLSLPLDPARSLRRALAESDALLVNSKKFREASMAYPAAATLGRHLTEDVEDVEGSALGSWSSV